MGRELAKGDIPTLILAILAEGPCHGYSIAREVERRSRDLLKLREGSLYPALRLLEHDGMIAGEWEVQPSGPARRVYRITPNGRREFAKRAGEWKKYLEAVNSLLGGSADAQRA